MRAAQKLLGAPTINGGGGGCPDRGWWWRKLKKANKPPSHMERKNGTENGHFRALIELKIAENAVFLLKSTK
jgi:hypothetical protein